MKVLFTASALFGALAVVLGAFGAHRLKVSLTADQLQTFDTGVRYHFYHVFAAMVACLLILKFPTANFAMAGWLFLLGIVLFSGSIYLLACKDLLHLGSFVKVIGPITPLGGLILISGWVILALNIFRSID